MENDELDTVFLYFDDLKVSSWMKLEDNIISKWRFNIFINNYGFVNIIINYIKFNQPVPEIHVKLKGHYSREKRDNIISCLLRNVA